MQNIFSIIIPLSPDFKERKPAALEKCSMENLSQLHLSNSFSLSGKWSQLFQQCLKGQTSAAGAKPRISVLHRAAKLRVFLSTATNTACTVTAPLLWERWALGEQLTVHYLGHVRGKARIRVNRKLFVLPHFFPPVLPHSGKWKPGTMPVFLFSCKY